MHVISVFNQKGGVGKTTVTANLGAELARRGYRVLLVDVDPQGSLTMTFAWAELWRTHMIDARRTVAELVLGEAPHADKVGQVTFQPETVAEALDQVGSRGLLEIVASHPTLRNGDLELAALLSATTERQKAQNWASVYPRLTRALDGANYDVVLFDCPPAFSVTTRMAVAASHHVLAPTRPDYLSTSGIDEMLGDLSRWRDTYNATVGGRARLAPQATADLLGVLFVMVSENAGRPIQAQQTYVDHVKALGHPTLEQYLTTQNTHYGEMDASGVPIVLSPYARHRETVARLRAVTDEVVRRIGLGKAA